MIKVAMQMHPIGDLQITPYDDEICDLIVKHLADFQVESTGTVLIDDYKVGGFLAEHVPNDDEQHDMLSRGYEIEVKVDPWEMGHWYGWDTHTLFERAQAPCI